MRDFKIHSKMPIAHERPLRVHARLNEVMIPYLTTELVILSVLFFFLLFFFIVDFVVSVLCAYATTPVSRERPSIKLMIFFIW